MSSAIFRKDGWFYGTLNARGLTRREKHHDQRYDCEAEASQSGFIGICFSRTHTIPAQIPARGERWKREHDNFPVGQKISLGRYHAGRDYEPRHGRLLAHRARPVFGAGLFLIEEMMGEAGDEIFIKGDAATGGHRARRRHFRFDRRR